MCNNNYANDAILFVIVSDVTVILSVHETIMTIMKRVNDSKYLP